MCRLRAHGADKALTIDQSARLAQHGPLRLDVAAAAPPRPRTVVAPLTPFRNQPSAPRAEIAEKKF